MRGVILIAFFLIWSDAFGQKSEEVCISNKEQINIASDEVVPVFVARPATLKSGSATKAQIDVAFINFPEQAKKVFLDAVSIWENLITSEVPIRVVAQWEPMSGNILGKGMPSSFYKNFDGALLADVFYPVTLVEKLSGKNKNGSDADIFCAFNSNISWYLGTDGRLSQNQYDFLTSVLHEIAHGLGFSGFLDANNNEGFFSSTNETPSVYDYYILNESNQQISNSSVFTSPSFELYKQLTSNKLKIQAPVESYLQAGTKNWIYAPSTWQSGSSIYHTKESSLMSPMMFKGNAIHNPGENILTILAEIGWKTVSFEHEKIRDMEAATVAVPVNLRVNSDFVVDNSSVKVIFSTNYFTSSDSVSMNYNNTSGAFSGLLPVISQLGNIQYYFKLKTSDNREYRYPSLAPDKKLTFKIGPDYLSPVIFHNPTKIISEAVQNIEITALAEDNLGINKVKVEYKINGTTQEPVVLANDSINFFKGNIWLHADYTNITSLEYRIVAEDNSSAKNKKYAPLTGFYQVNVIQPETPVFGYFSDFNTTSADFVNSDFSISSQAGFYSGVLHSSHPYNVSGIENEIYNQIAQLKYPVVLKENGLMTFDEVVLVEPGTEGTSYTDPLFRDYVIVEGSKDNGVTWLPITKGYDAQTNEIWKSRFLTSAVNNSPVSSGSEDLLIHRTINLTDNTGFNKGDTILIRFRLASDASVNGWGWAIDNLEIQKLYTGNNEMEMAYEVKVYPNPFSNHLQIDFLNAASSQVEIAVFNLTGKTVYRELWSDISYDTKKQIDLTALESGIYLVQTTDENSNRFTQKIIKN